MKAELLEYDNCFRLEIVPETLEENMRLVRLGMGTTKAGATLFVSVGKEHARGSLSFKIKNNVSFYFAK